MKRMDSAALVATALAARGFRAGSARADVSVTFDSG